MARDYARIMTAIWKNKEFRALTEQQQRGYLFLVTQPDISAAGVLPLRVRRWADAASSSTPESLAQILKELEVGRFIYVDWDAEELLIRSFIRWDGGFNNPKRRPVIIRAAEEVESEAIAHHIATEFKRCGIKTPPDGPSGGGRSATESQAHSLSADAVGPAYVDPGDEPFPQVNSLSGSPPHVAPDTATTNHGRVPQPTTHNPQPLPPSAGAVAPGVQLAVIQGGAYDLEQTVEINAGHIMAAWVEAYTATGRQPTKDQRGKAAKDARQLLDAGNDPALVLSLAKAAGAKCRPTIANELSPSAAAHFPTAAAQPQQGTASQRANAFLALRKGEPA